MNKSCTLWIVDYIHMVRTMIAITNYFVKILKLKIKNYFEIQLETRYWQFVDEICCDGLKCNTQSILIFGDFMVAYFYELTFSGTLLNYFELRF